MKLKLLCSFLLFTFLQNTYAQVRQTIDFNKGWKFFLGNDSMASNENYTDVSWRNLSLPHDWSIEGNFSKDHPATNQGGALPGGIGWYRKTFTVPVAEKEKNISIEFDGVHRNSEVWINGHYLGKRPNGYISFSYDLTPYLKFGTGKNVIAVKVDNSQQPNSRWYTGSGIYRDVRLVMRNTEAFIRQIRITSFDIKKGTAEVGLNTTIGSDVKKQKWFSLVVEIYDKTGKEIVADERTSFDKLGFTGSSVHHAYSTNIIKPVLWSVNNPYLYKMVVKVFQKGNW